MGNVKHGERSCLRGDRATALKISAMTEGARENKWKDEINAWTHLLTRRTAQSAKKLLQLLVAPCIPGAQQEMHVLSRLFATASFQCSGQRSQTFMFSLWLIHLPPKVQKHEH